MAEIDRKTVKLDELVNRHIQNHQKPYFDWLRHVVTLSLGALTALVALQGHYIPRQPTLKSALVLCWIALLASMLLGLIALKEEYLGPLKRAQRIQDMRQYLGDPDTANRLNQGGLKETPGKAHSWAAAGTFAAFATAMSSLCLFAAANFLQA